MVDILVELITWWSCLSHLVFACHDRLRNTLNRICEILTEICDCRDLMDAREAEYRAWARVQSLKSSLDEHNLELRVKMANEAEARSQQKLAAAEAEIADMRQKLEDSKRLTLEVDVTNWVCCLIWHVCYMRNFKIYYLFCFANLLLIALIRFFMNGEVFFWSSFFLFALFCLSRIKVVYQSYNWSYFFLPLMAGASSCSFLFLLIVIF